MGSALFIGTGNLGRDAEVRYTTSGTAICSFSIPCDIGWGDNKKTEWVNCVIIGKRAEGKLPEYLKKGQAVYVVGEPKCNVFTTKQGEAKGSIEVVVDKLELMGKRADNPNTPETPRQDAHNQAKSNGYQPQGGDDFDDDIPFAQFMRGTIA